MAKPNGYVVYRGPSKLNGENIRVIITGYKRGSNNPKTGNMLQMWIMPEGEIVEAFRTNADESVCGDCKLKGSVKGKRVCYVNLHGPMSIHKADTRGSYSSEDTPQSRRGMRLGAWGDPAAVPARVLHKVLKTVPDWTGYTHQWNKGRFQYLQKYVMASVDNLGEYIEAKNKGWRTFRILRPDEELQENEIMCPEYCDRCNLCKGTSSNSTKDIAIKAHGMGAGNLMEV